MDCDLRCLLPRNSTSGYSCAPPVWIWLSTNPCHLPTDLWGDVCPAHVCRIPSTILPANYPSLRSQDLPCNSKPQPGSTQSDPSITSKSGNTRCMPWFLNAGAGERSQTFAQHCPRHSNAPLCPDLPMKPPSRPLAAENQHPASNRSKNEDGLGLMSALLRTACTLVAGTHFVYPRRPSPPESTMRCTQTQSLLFSGGMRIGPSPMTRAHTQGRGRLDRGTRQLRSYNTSARRVHGVRRRPHKASIQDDWSSARPTDTSLSGTQTDAQTRRQDTSSGFNTSTAPAQCSPSVQSTGVHEPVLNAPLQFLPDCTRAPAPPPPPLPRPPLPAPDGSLTELPVAAAAGYQRDTAWRSAQVKGTRKQFGGARPLGCCQLTPVNDRLMAICRHLPRG